ncbi:hypothetical protein J6590_084166, partial [Homalodisca vitripennis]
VICFLTKVHTIKHRGKGTWVCSSNRRKLERLAHDAIIVISDMPLPVTVAKHNTVVTKTSFTRRTSHQ